MWLATGTAFENVTKYRAYNSERHSFLPFLIQYCMLMKRQKQVNMRHIEYMTDMATV